jgi:dihydrofolate reductase
MRKLVATEYVTLDGVFEAPNQWSFDFWNEEAMTFKFDELFASDALLLGRLTYEGFAKAWPDMTDDKGFADRMNGMPKYVVSTTLQDPEWNNSTVISTDVPKAVAALKEEPGKDLLLAGSGQLLRTLTEQGLVDEYRLMTHPIVVGAGTHLFTEGFDRTVMHLVDTMTFSTGIVVLTYEPARGSAA